MGGYTPSLTPPPVLHSQRLQQPLGEGHDGRVSGGWRALIRLCHGPLWSLGVGLLSQEGMCGDLFFSNDKPDTKSVRVNALVLSFINDTTEVNS